MDDCQAILHSREKFRGGGLEPHWNRIDFKAFRLCKFLTFYLACCKQATQEGGLLCRFT
jgi:hypothetical protein